MLCFYFIVFFVTYRNKDVIFLHFYAKKECKNSKKKKKKSKLKKNLLATSPILPQNGKLATPSRKARRSQTFHEVIFYCLFLRSSTISRRANVTCLSFRGLSGSTCCKMSLEQMFACDFLSLFLLSPSLSSAGKAR